MVLYAQQHRGVAEPLLSSDSEWAGPRNIASKPSVSEDEIEKWWEIDLRGDQSQLKHRGGASPVVSRCIRNLNWSRSFTGRVVLGYRQFMELKCVMDDWESKKLEAPLPIRQMWEQHILDNLTYARDCVMLFGRVIGHDPDAGMIPRATAARIETTKIAFQARFGPDLDPDVWDWGISSDHVAAAAATIAQSPSTAIDAEAEEQHKYLDDNRPRGGRLPVVRAGSPSKERQPLTGSYAGVSRTRSCSPVRDRYYCGSMTTDDEAGQQQQGTATSPLITPTVKRSRLRSPSPARRAQSAPNSPQTPGSQGSGQDLITISVRDTGSGDETFFSMRYRSTLLRTVFVVYAQRKGLKQESLKFSYNGQLLTGYETPHSLGLDDKDQIDVFDLN